MGFCRRGGFHFFQCLLVIGRSRLFFTFFIGGSLAYFSSPQDCASCPKVPDFGISIPRYRGDFFTFEFCLSFRGIWPLCLAMSLRSESTATCKRDRFLVNSLFPLPRLTSWRALGTIKLSGRGVSQRWTSYESTKFLLGKLGWLTSSSLLSVVVGALWVDAIALTMRPSLRTNICTCEHQPLSTRRKKRT